MHKPRVFFSNLSRDTIGMCKTHHEFSMDKVVEIIGPHLNVERQRAWERNREVDVSVCISRGIPSYNMLNSMMETDPDPEQMSADELDRVISIPSFRLAVPTKWELKAEVNWRADAPPEDVYISGRIDQKMRVVPEPYQPGDFFDVFHQEEVGRRHEPELSVQEFHTAIRNIDLQGMEAEDARSQEQGVWIEQLRLVEGRRSVAKVKLAEISLPTESQMETGNWQCPGEARRQTTPPESCESWNDPQRQRGLLRLAGGTQGVGCR